MNHKTNTHNLEGLDALRGVLSLIVCAAHAWQTFIYPVSPGKGALALLFGLSARLAVLGFFCLSGYVITLSISRNIQRHGKFKLPDFATARFFRIAPPLLFAVAFVLLLSAIAGQLGYVDIPSSVHAARNSFTVQLKSQLVSLLTLCLRGDLTGTLNGPLWSLTYEIQLYVIYGLLAYLLCARGRVSYWLVAALALAFYGRHAFHPGPAANIQLVCYSCFLFGSLAFMFSNKLPKVALRYVATLTALIGIGIGIFYGRQYLLNDLDSTKPLILMQIILGAAFALFVVIVARADHFRKMADIGRYSYTLYIVHFPILLFAYFVLFHVDRSLLNGMPWLWAVVMPIVAVSFAKVISRYVENAKGHRAFFSGIAMRQFGKLKETE